MTHMKLAELTSGVGALVLGVGLGGLFPQWFGPAAGLITVVGLSLHGFGMRRPRCGAWAGIDLPPDAEGCRRGNHDRGRRAAGITRGDSTAP